LVEGEKMSQGTRCRCAESKKPIEQRNWEILQYKCNYSAFSGYRYTQSDYSAVRCGGCSMVWRTKANYVNKIK